jgi:hypothetical protein
VTPDTWTDPASGLTWQARPLIEVITWDEAIDYCSNLSLAEGGWRLPTISELKTLLPGGGEVCGVSDECNSWEDCWEDRCNYSIDYYPYGSVLIRSCNGPPQLPGGCRWYWSSTPVSDLKGYAWYLDFSNALIYPAPMKYSIIDGVRCVR